MSTASGGLHRFISNRSWGFWVVCGYVLIVVVFCVFWVWSLYGPLSSTLIDEQRQSLVAVAQSGSMALGETDDDADDFACGIVEGTGLRATIIAKDGTVLGDSTKDASQIENHLSRPEVQAALSGEVGTDQRMSSTDGNEQLYVAVPATYRGENVVFRVSAAVDSIDTFINSIRVFAFTLLVVGIVLAALIAWRSYVSASAPVGRLEKVRSDFVANASHELKTPVAGIQLLSDAITSASDDGDLDSTKMFAKRLSAEADRLQHLVYDLLDLSRLENEASDAPETTDMHAAVSTSFEAHRAEAKAKGLDFVFDDKSKATDNCHVRINATDASLIIDNLLDNAIRYTEEGSVTVAFTATDAVVFSVADTGIGIPVADRSRIFERFYRVDTARSREKGGTGLGLSLVRHAVKRGSGTVEVTGELGEGTTFTVTFPQAQRHSKRPGND